MPHSSGWPGPDSCICTFDSLLSGDFFRKISKLLILVGILDQSKLFKRAGFQVITHDTVPIFRRVSQETRQMAQGRATIMIVKNIYTVLGSSVPQKLRVYNLKILACCRHHSLPEIGVPISPKFPLSLDRSK